KRFSDKTQLDVATYLLPNDWRETLVRMQTSINSHFRAAGWLTTRPTSPTDAGATSVHLHIAPLATGNQVIADATTWERILDAVRTTLALDMEAAAVGQLAFDRRLDCIAMKGVMDHADAKRDDQFKEFAARAAAECLLWFLRTQMATEVIPGFDDLLTEGT